MSARAFESPMAEQHLAAMKKFLGEYSETMIDLEESMADRVSLVWDPSNDPIGLVSQPFEAKRIQDLFSSDNKPFDKVMTVCSYLCWEIQQLQAQAAEKFYGPLSLFGVTMAEVSPNDTGHDEEIPEGELELQVGRLMEKLKDLRYFVERARGVGQNLMQQLANLYKDDRVRGQTTSFTGVHIATIFEHIGELCTMFISLDEIIDCNENIRDGLNAYKDMMKTIAQDPGRFGTDATALDHFDEFINTMEDELLDGRIFAMFTDQEFTRPGEIAITSNKSFMKEFFSNVAQMSANVAQNLFGERLRLGRKALKQGREVVGLYGLFIMYCRMSRVAPDKRLYKELYMLHRQIPGVVIYDNVVFLPQDLLASMVPPPPGSIKLEDLTGARTAYVQSVDRDLGPIAMAAYRHGCDWLVQLEDSMSSMVRGVDLYKSSLSTGELLVEGVLIAHQNGYLLRTYMNLHQHMQIPYRKADLQPLFMLIELQHTLGRSFARRHGQIALRLTLVVRHVTRYLSDMLAPIKQKLEKSLAGAGGLRSRKAEGAMVDMLSAVRLMMNLLDGCVGPERLLVLNLTWELFAPRSRDYAPKELMKAFDEQLFRLGVLVRIQDLMKEGCDLSFLFHQLELFPPMIKRIFDDTALAPRLPMTIAALEDAALRLKHTCHEGEGDATLQAAFMKEVIGYLEEAVIQPLCTDVETDLRMHIHSAILVQELEQRNPLRDGVKDLSRFFTLPPIRFCGTSVRIKERVQHYLNSTFYNLTTVALHNWMSYSEMRNLAREKFGLELSDGYLPGQTLQQGLDVLVIMRNIHIFTARYHYNLNAQFFVEADTETRHLNSINIQHIANSIRTHGIGIMNTTINFIYQFLVQKFMTFSQFLYDDNIKSRLMKDVRFFKTKRKELDSKYPHARAEAFMKSIKRMGMAHGIDFLGAFRKLVTEIGNALGYVRMIRSGGLRYCSEATKFIPDLTVEPTFEEHAKDSELPDSTVASCKVLDDIIKNLQETSSEGADYFDLMVGAFAGELRIEQNDHLKNFFVIVPPLMLAYVDHMLLEKDRMGKKGKFGCFTDDGFAIGVAYILSVLKQNGKFESLHWFDSLTDEFKEQERQLNAARAAPRDQDDLAQHSLRMRKLRNRKAEFDLLYYAFNGARIFFRGEGAKVTTPSSEAPGGGQSAAEV
jgi:WASH complex subunit 7